MTDNVRFIFENVADLATVTASTTAGALAASNLIVDEVAAVWRSTAVTATLTFTWAGAVNVDSVVLAWANLSPASNMRLRGYALSTDTATLFDTTVIPDPRLLGDLLFGLEPLMGSAAARVGVSLNAMAWLDQVHNLRKLTIDITDTYNGAGYIEVSRAIAGVRFEPETDVSYPFAVGVKDASRPVRAESGDVRVDSLAQYRTFDFNIERMPVVAERNMMARLLRQGLGRGVFVSVFPTGAETTDQQLGSFWGTRMQTGGLLHPFLGQWSTGMSFEEMG